MEILKELRKQSKKSQADMAKMLSISQAAYSKYECGLAEPDSVSLKKLADYFNVSVDYLLGREEYSTAPQITIPDSVASVPIAFHNISDLTQAEIDDAEAYILFKRKQRGENK